MGLNVLTDFSKLVGKTLVAYKFDYDNESIIYMMDGAGNESRYRISSTIRDMLVDFSNIAIAGEYELEQGMGCK